MNENIDLTKILDGCPEGTKFYSSDFGEVTFFEISPYDWDHYPIKLHYPGEVSSRPLIASLTKNGQNVYGYDGECTLFPSKNQRDWSKFVRFWDNPKVEKSKVERFNPKTLQPFDEVLVRDLICDCWNAVPFSHINFKRQAICCGVSWEQCVPYNEETKYLVNTNEDCPEYYKWWEENKL